MLRPKMGGFLSPKIQPALGKLTATDLKPKRVLKGGHQINWLKVELQKTLPH